MRNPFTARRPWAAFLVALVLNPVVGMLYIGRARLAGAYLLIALGLIAGFVKVYPAGFGDLGVQDAVSVVQILYCLAGALHAALLAWWQPFVFPGRWYSCWYAVLGLPIGYFALTYAALYLFFHPYIASSQAMEPTIGKGDFVFALPQAFGEREPARGDVVVYYNTSSKTTYIKRIIGIPNDRIEIRDGVVILNGKPLPRTVVSPAEYLQKERIADRSYFIRKDPYIGIFNDLTVVTVPPGKYYVMGDSRDNSLDSRSNEVGFIPRANITGLASVRVFDGEERRFVWQPIR